MPWLGKNRAPRHFSAKAGKIRPRRAKSEIRCTGVGKKNHETFYAWKDGINRKNMPQIGKKMDQDGTSNKLIFLSKIII